MAVPLNTVIRVSARFKNTSAGDVVNVYHWKTGGSGTPSETDVMNAIDTKLSTMWTLLNTNMPEEQDPYDIRYDLVDLVGGVEVVTQNLGTRSWTVTTPPSASTDGLPPMDAAVVNLRTAIPRVFGRKYIGQLTETTQNDGLLTGTILTNLASFITEYLTPITVSGTFTLTAGVITPRSATQFAAFISGAVNAVVGSQRRRRKGTGS